VAEVVSTRVLFADLDAALIRLTRQRDGLDKAAIRHSSFAATLVERIDGELLHGGRVPGRAYRRGPAAARHTVCSRRVPSRRRNDCGKAAPHELASTLPGHVQRGLGIDLGTANTSSTRTTGRADQRAVGRCVPHQRRLDRGGRSSGKELDGRTPGRIEVVRPLRGGTISDFRGAHALVKTVVDRALARGPRIAPRVIACVPGWCDRHRVQGRRGSDPRRGPAHHDLRSAGGRAAVGAGLDITGTRPAMVIDIGGGTTEIAVLTLCGVVAMSSIKVGGDTFDAAITARLRNEFFGIGP